MNTVNALLFISEPVKKCCMDHSIIIHLPCKAYAICTDNLSCLLYEADPQYVWQVVDVNGRDAFCLQETVFGFRSYQMKKYFLQPFGVKVGVGFLLVVCHESIA